jgi:outer membrane protein assembly factor BamA
LFIGQPWLVRGYDARSFMIGETDVYDRLFGSRMGITNLELRLPLVGGVGLVRTLGVPPIEVAAFYDAGAAWTDGDRARFLGGGRVAVTSFGTTMRVNLFGLAVAEIAYVHPNDRPLKGWFWQFNLQPGF